MKLGSLLKRGWNILKVGKAVKDMRSAVDETDRKRAHHYLVEVLGQSRGLPTKVAQLMTMDGQDYDLRNTLGNSIPAVPFKEVAKVLKAAYGVAHGEIFSQLEEKGRTASLGQVHFGVLKKDKRRVAVKVQYPEIADSVEAEMGLMGFLPKVGPAKRWGFNLEGYRDIFWENFSEELDYRIEIEHQKTFRKRVRSLGDVVAPEVVEELCRANVLVQTREDGFSLDEAEKLPQSDRQNLGRILLRQYLHMIFHEGYVHADPNPENFAFRRLGPDKFELVIYDFGSVIEIPESMRLTLVRVILALQNREAVDPAGCLAGMGFDQDKLDDLRPVLPALLQVLFEPFLLDAPFDVKTWNINERVETIAGELKWWFRSAAPPSLIFLMRVLHGMTTMFRRLDARLPWKFILQTVCGDVYPQALAVVLPDAKSAKGFAPKFDGLAKFMMVKVAKPNGTRVHLSMPARVAENIEDVLDQPVKDAIVRAKIDLPAIQDRVRRSGFVPQVVFELNDPERNVKIWLE
jgi:predicted unusual protein kinase regulating ubiquinone biosynthesis (AarF/ABC1/UbiB family)